MKRRIKRDYKPSPPLSLSSSAHSNPTQNNIFYNDAKWSSMWYIVSTLYAQTRPLLCMFSSLKHNHYSLAGSFFACCSFSKFIRIVYLRSPGVTAWSRVPQGSRSEGICVFCVSRRAIVMVILSFLKLEAVRFKLRHSLFTRIVYLSQACKLLLCRIRFYR